MEHQADDLDALRMLDQLCVKQGRMKDLAEVLKPAIGKTYTFNANLK